MKIRNIILALAAMAAIASCAGSNKVEEQKAAYQEVMDSLSVKVKTYIADNLQAFMANDSLAMAGYEEIIEEVRAFNKETFEKNRKNELGAKSFSVLAQIIDDQDEVYALSRKLSPKVIEADEKLQALIKGLEKSRATAAGTMFSDFEVTTVEGFYADGNEIKGTAKLSDYVGKGKFILVDFWASWCNPCRGEIPNIKKAYDAFAGDRFDILSIAVWDRPAEAFKAIEEEGLVWNQMVLAEESRSVPTDVYGIQGIPQIILFAPDGTVLKRDLRGEEISKAIAEAIAQ